MDDLRLLLMREPRGHSAMSGAILQPPTRDDADWGVLFIEVSGLPADVRARDDRRRDGAGGDRDGGGHRAGDRRPARHAGRARRGAGRRRGRARGSVTLRNVPSFLCERDGRESTAARVTYDMAFGGNFYAILPAAARSRPAPPTSDRSRQLAIMAAINARPPVHPGRADLRLPPRNPSRARPDGADARAATAIQPGWLDRSPCGTGTSARMAQLHARGELALGEPFVNESVIGTRFTGRLVEETTSPGGRRSCPRSPAARGSPAWASTCSTPRIRSPPASHCEPGRRGRRRGHRGAAPRTSWPERGCRARRPRRRVGRRDRTRRGQRARRRQGHRPRARADPARARRLRGARGAAGGGGSGSVAKGGAGSCIPTRARRGPGSRRGLGRLRGGRGSPASGSTRTRCARRSRRSTDRCSARPGFPAGPAVRSGADHACARAERGGRCGGVGPVGLARSPGSLSQAGGSPGSRRGRGGSSRPARSSWAGRDRGARRSRPAPGWSCRSSRARASWCGCARRARTSSVTRSSTAPTSARSSRPTHHRSPRSSRRPGEGDVLVGSSRGARGFDVAVDPCGVAGDADGRAAVRGARLPGGGGRLVGGLRPWAPGPPAGHAARRAPSTASGWRRDGHGGRRAWRSAR